MKYLSLCLVGMTLLLTLSCQAQDKGRPGTWSVPAAVDTRVDAKLMKALRVGVPRKAFKQGHVKPLDVSKIKPVKHGTGFAVQFPSKSPVPSAAVYQNRIYVGGGFNSKTFFCLDALTGKPVWGVNLDDDGPSAPVCADGLVVFNTESCTIFALEAATGKLRWAHWMGDPMMAMPAIADGRVYTSYPRAGNAGTSHVLACLDLPTGKVLWERWLDCEVMTAPVLARGELFVNTFSGHAYVFDPKTGELKSVSKERATSAPTVLQKEIVMSRRVDTGKGGPLEAFVRKSRSGSDRTARAMGKARKAVWLDGKVQRASRLGALAGQQDALNGFSGGAPAGANAKVALENIGYANVSSLQGYQGARALAFGQQLYRCDGDTLSCIGPSGKTTWSFKVQGDLRKTGGFLATPPLAAGGYVFTATFKGELLQVDPAKGTVVKRYAIGGNVRFQPVAVGGRVYVTTTRGKVVCVDTRDPKVTGWPMWGKDAAHTGVQNEPSN